MKQMQCNALNIKTTAKQVWLYFRGHYHESSDCFEIKPHKNTCQIFVPQKHPRIENFKNKKILRSSPSLEIRSTPTVGTRQKRRPKSCQQSPNHFFRSDFCITQ